MADKVLKSLQFPGSGDVYTVPQAGVPGGTASLDESGKVPYDQLPEMNYMPLDGGTFKGPVTLSGDPTEDLHPATKQYVDNVKRKVGIELLGSASYSRVQYQTGAITKTFDIGDMSEFWLNMKSSITDTGTDYSYLYFYDGTTAVYGDRQAHAVGRVIHAKKVGDYWIIEDAVFSDNYATQQSVVTNRRIYNSAPINKIVFTDNSTDASGSSGSAYTVTITIHGTLA